MAHDAALYFATPEDRAAALLQVAGLPIAFRAVMAAVRAGAPSVGVPSVFRGTAVEEAIARTRSARAAVMWLEPGSPPPVAPVVLVPAASIPAPAVLAALAGRTVVTVLAQSDGTPSAPVVAAPAEIAGPLWSLIAAGAPLGDALDRALGSLEPSAASSGEPWVVQVNTADSVAEAERSLFVRLGSPIDTWFDTVFHRRLSRHVSTVAIHLGIGPNPITVASLLVGLAAVWCFVQASPATALLGLAVYAAAVVLDHADGEVARLTFSESAAGEWLDVTADTVVHTLLVLAMGMSAAAVAGAGAALGVVAAAGVVVSAVLAKLWPPVKTAGGLGRVLDRLSSRDGFYALLILFIAGLAFRPASLPLLMIVVAFGTHAYWLARVAHRAAGRLRPR